MERSAYAGRSLALREIFQAREAEIHSVTVYRDRAEVKRSVRLRVEAGENEVVVTGLPTCTDKNSIRLDAVQVYGHHLSPYICVRVEGLSEAGGKVIITDVVYSADVKPLHRGEGEGEYERLRGVVKEKERELKYLEFKEAALAKQRTLLLKFAGHVTKVSSRKVTWKSFKSSVSMYV